MPTKIMTFDPLSDEEKAKAESELDELFSDGWEIKSTIGGNRAGRGGEHSSRGFISVEDVASEPPVFKDYVLLILYKEKQETPEFRQGKLKSRNPIFP